MNWARGVSTRNLVTTTTASPSTTSRSSQEELLKSELNRVQQQQQQQFPGTRGRHGSTLSSSLVSALRHFSQRIPTSRLKERLCQTRHHEFLMKRENKVEIESLLDKVRDVVNSITLTSPKELLPMDRTRFLAWTSDVTKVLSDFTPSEHHQKDPLVVLIAKLQALQNSTPLCLGEAAADARHLLEKWERLGLFDDSDSEDSDEMDNNNKDQDDPNTNSSRTSTQDGGGGRGGGPRRKQSLFVPQMLKDRRRASSNVSKVGADAVASALALVAAQSNLLTTGPQTSSDMVPLPSRMEMSWSYQRVRSRAAERVIKRNIIKWARSRENFYQDMEEIKSFGSTTKIFMQWLMVNNYKQQRKKKQEEAEEEVRINETQRTYQFMMQMVAHQSIFLPDLMNFSKHMAIFPVDEAIRQVEYVDMKIYLYKNRCALKLQAVWREYKTVLGRRVLHETKAVIQKLGKQASGSGGTGGIGGRRKSSRLVKKQPSSRLQRNSTVGRKSFATINEDATGGTTGDATGGATAERRRRTTTVKPAPSTRQLLGDATSHPQVDDPTLIVDVDEKKYARFMDRFGLDLFGHQFDYNNLSEEELERMIAILQEHEMTATTIDEEKDLEQFVHLLERLLTSPRQSRLIQETETDVYGRAIRRAAILRAMDWDSLISTAKDDGLTTEERLVKLRRMTTFQDHGLTLQDHGLTLQDHGLKLQDNGLTLQDHGLKLQDHGLKLQDHGLKLQDHGLKLQDHELKRQDHGLKLQDHELKRQDHGVTLSGFESDPDKLTIMEVGGGLGGLGSGSSPGSPTSSLTKRMSVIGAQTESAKRRSVSKAISVTRTTITTVALMRKLKAVQPFANSVEEEETLDPSPVSPFAGTRLASRVESTRKHLYNLPIDHLTSSIVPGMKQLLPLTIDTHPKEEEEGGGRVSSSSSMASLASPTSSSATQSPQMKNETQRDRLQRVAWLKARMKIKTKKFQELVAAASTVDSTSDSPKVPSRVPTPPVMQVQEDAVHQTPTHRLLLERVNASSSKDQAIAIVKAEAEQIVALIENETILIAREAQLTPDNFRQFLQVLERDQLIQDASSIAQVYEEMLWAPHAASSRMSSRRSSTKSPLAVTTEEEEDIQYEERESNFEYGISKEITKEWKRSQSFSPLHHQPKPPPALSSTTTASIGSMLASSPQRNRNVSIATSKAFSRASIGHADSIRSRQAMSQQLQASSVKRNLGSIVPRSSGNSTEVLPVLHRQEEDTAPNEEDEEEEDEEDQFSTSETEEDDESSSSEEADRKSQSPIRSRLVPSHSSPLSTTKKTRRRMTENERQATFQLLMTTYLGLLHTPRENLLKDKLC